MRKKTSKYISLLLIISSVFASISAYGQNKSKTKPEEKISVPFYQGMAMEIEVAGIGSYLLGSDILNTELHIQANLKNRFFPVIEVGYGKADATNDANQLHYKTSAPYFRIGIDYNFFHKKTHLPGYLYGGLRYGMSSFTYDIEGPTMTDPNYGGQIEIPYSYNGLKSKAGWIEAVVGIKVKIYKSFHMGWNVRYKMRMNVQEHDNSQPWYVPGFGKNAGSSFNLNYNLIYNLPF